MGWTKTATLPATVVTDAAIQALIAGATTTRDAVDARVKVQADWILAKDYTPGAGLVDETANAQAALNAVDPAKGKMKVYFGPGTYLINGVNSSKPDGASRGIDAGLIPKAGTTIVLDAGAIIKVITNNSQGYAAFYVGPDIDNVTIKGPGSIVGDRDTHDYTTAGTHEWGYGVYGRGAQNLTVDGVNISKMTGDSVLAGPVGSVDDADPTYNPSSGRIINCYLDGARRNNISLIGCDHFLIENNTITRAGYNDGVHDGTAPRAGIDLEFSSSQAVKNTVIRGNRFVGNITASVEAFNSSGLHVEANFMDSQIIVGAHVLNNATIIGNLVQNLADTTTSGIALSGGSVGGNNVLVADNMILGFGTGTFLTGFGVTCSGNYIAGFTIAGVSAYLATDISILNNHIADPATGTTAAGIKYLSPATGAPRVEAVGNRISNCYYGMNWTQGSTGITAKGNIISKAFIAFNLGANCAGIIEGNVTDLPGHSSTTQGSDVVYTSTSKVQVLGNTFRNSSAPSVAAISGGSGGTSRIIGNKIINTTSTIGITCVGGTHEVVGNILSTAIASGALYAIQITGAALNCIVTGNTAYHTGASPWSRLVKSDAATGTPATVITGNTFLDGTIVATPNASDVIGPNIASNGLVSPPRLLAVTDTATLNIDASSYDRVKVTALAQVMTIAAPTGTPAGMQSLVIRIKDAGTAKALTWNAAFRAVGITLPLTTVVSKTVYVGCIWNSDAAKWDVIAVAQE